jgi:site-specific DNA-methyltransferase (adenine-specific)
MQQLVRICPEGGTVLDPFTGSGTTGVAALREGRDFIGVELSDHYAGIAERRLQAAALTQDDVTLVGPEE